MVLFTVEQSPESNLMKGPNQALTLQKERRGERRWRDEGVLDLQLWKCGIFPQCWSDFLQINEEPCLKVNYTIFTINLLMLAVGISIYFNKPGSKSHRKEESSGFNNRRYFQTFQRFYETVGIDHINKSDLRAAAFYWLFIVV